MFKWYTVRIRTWLGIYGQIYPFAFRSSLGLCPLELLQPKGYIWPYIPRLVLIRIQYSTFTQRWKILQTYVCAIKILLFLLQVYIFVKCLHFYKFRYASWVSYELLVSNIAYIRYGFLLIVFSQMLVKFPWDLN